jgi:pyruvate/2-oxoglutarate dehydrogenase complex dihydrolipoamide dehydrogenase (E3) component
VLGGGAVGVELAQAFARLGSKVTIVEAGPRFLGLEEPEAGVALMPHLQADGIEIRVGDPGVAVENQASDVVLHLKSGAIVAGDRLLVATGRRATIWPW